MTPQEDASEVVRLIERATLAIRAGQHNFALELLRRALTITESLPKKKESGL